jgi:HAMP domain-containing protein
VTAPGAPLRSTLRRWVWSSIRPFAGWLLALLGAIALFLGWYGVSGTPIPAKQLPYLVSGGMTGVALVVLAAAFFATDDVRRQLDDLRDVAAKVDQLYDLLTEPVPQEREPPPVVVPGGRTLHRPGCRLVAGKTARVATDDELAALRPCRVCTPSE